MRMFEDFKAAYLKHEARVVGRGGPRRDLTEDDRGSWFDAGTERMEKSKQELRTMEDAKRAVQARNPMRWRRLQSDFRWTQRQMKKLGLNPEDARFLL